MDAVLSDAKKIVATIGNLFKRENFLSEFRVLSEGECVIEKTGYDNWDGGTDIYGIFCKIPVALYSEIELEIPSIEQSIKKRAEAVFRSYPRCWIGEVVVSPILSDVIHGKQYKVSTEELIIFLQQQRALMISVATGGQKIQAVNQEFLERSQKIEEGLAERSIKNLITFKDLWAWYGKWSDGTLPSYQSRRVFISEIFDALESEAKKTKANSVSPVFEAPTGWLKVDRGIGEIKFRLVQAKTEEQFQTIGLLGRETLISLAQSVFDADKHPTHDGIPASKTDAKRMLDAYIAVVLPGGANESVRRHAKASLDLANELTHKRTADFRLAALSAEATCAVVNIISIISGRRDAI